MAHVGLSPSLHPTTDKCRLQLLLSCTCLRSLLFSSWVDGAHVFACVCTTCRGSPFTFASIFLPLALRCAMGFVSYYTGGSHAKQLPQNVSLAVQCSSKKRKRRKSSPTPPTHESDSRKGNTAHAKSTRASYITTIFFFRREGDSGKRWSATAGAVLAGTRSSYSAPPSTRYFYDNMLDIQTARSYLLFHLFRSSCVLT